jgi:hypothetical protein
MKQSVAPVILMIVCLSFTPVLAQYTIWHSPLTFSTDNANLTIEPSIPSTTIRVTTQATGDLQWIELGLVLPSNVDIDTVVVCYELNSADSYISQVRLTQTTIPDAAWVYHDDPTDLVDLGPTCYHSPVGELIPAGTITLAFRLNFNSTSDWIDIGGIGIVVSPITAGAESDGDQDHPDRLTLRQNQPNPFGPNTLIRYDIQRQGRAQLRIYNSLGQLVRTLVDEEKPVGSYQIVWDGSNDEGQRLSSGTYYYQLKVADVLGTERMLLLK